MEWFWFLFWCFFLVAYLVMFVHIVADLFRDRDLSGWWKALWLVALVVVPFVSALVYLIARGHGMAERHAERHTHDRAATDAALRDAARTDPTAQISQAKALLDAGAIDEREYAALKAGVIY